MEQIASIIRDRIEELGMKQAIVAARAGMPSYALSLVLNGNRRLTATEFIGVCRVLGLTLDNFSSVTE